MLDRLHCINRYTWWQLYEYVWFVKTPVDLLLPHSVFYIHIIVYVVGGGIVFPTTFVNDSIMFLSDNDKNGVEESEWTWFNTELSLRGGGEWRFRTSSCLFLDEDCQFERDQVNILTYRDLLNVSPINLFKKISQTKVYRINSGVSPLF